MFVVDMECQVTEHNNLTEKNRKERIKFVIVISIMDAAILTSAIH